MYGQVYLRWCTVSQKGYVGQTTQGIEKRLYRGYRSSVAMGNAIRKYGDESFQTTILAEADSKEELDTLERAYITLFNTVSPNGYNLKGGGSAGKHHEIARIKMGNGSRDWWAHPENHVYMSTKLKGKQKSAKTRSKMSVAQKKRGNSYMTPEWIAKLSATQKERFKDPEVRAKAGVANKGRIPWNKGGKPNG